MSLSGHYPALQILGILLLVGYHLATRFDQVSAFQDAMLTFTMKSRQTWIFYFRDPLNPIPT